MVDPQDTGLRCIDALVGERILDLEAPALGADDRVLLEAHVDACAFCRLTLDLHRQLGEGIRDGSIAQDDRDRTAPGRRRRIWAAWTSVVAAAASVACLLMLPPRPVGPSIAGRGPDGVRFLRPVEGEVVRSGDLAVAWTDVPGATSYRVRVTGLKDDSTWTEQAQENRLVIPADRGLNRDREYRLLLSTVPGDLLPPGGASVTFRTGGTAAVLFHRVRRAQFVTYGLALMSLASIALWALGRHAARRFGELS